MIGEKEEDGAAPRMERYRATLHNSQGRPLAKLVFFRDSGTLTLYTCAIEGIWCPMVEAFYPSNAEAVAQVDEIIGSDRRRQLAATIAAIQERERQKWGSY